MKIVERRLTGDRKLARRKPLTRVVTSAQGKRVKAVQLDSDSATFSEELLASFARNVTRARRANKALSERREEAEDGDAD